MKSITLYLFKINRLVSTISILVVLSISLIAMIGWYTGDEYLKTLSLGSVSMKINTLFSFVFISFSLIVLLYYNNVKPLNWVLNIMIYITLIISVLTILEYIFDINLFIDELIVKESPEAAHTSSPGRMSIYTAGGFIFCAIAILLYKKESDRYTIIAQVLSLFLFLLSLLPLLGYLYGSSELYGISGFTKMALNTSISFFILSIGMIFMRPSKGILEITTYDTIGGHLARRLIPISLLISISPLWVSLIFNKNTHLNTITLIYIGTILLIVSLIVFIWRFLVSLNVMERTRSLAQSETKGWQNLMQYIIKYDPNAIGVMDKELRYIFVSERFLQDYGIADENVIGKSHYEIFPEIPERWKEIHKRTLKGEVISVDEDSFIRENGRLEYNRWECRPWYTSDGSIGGMILYSEVITKRKQVEKEKERLNEQLFKLVSTIKDLSQAHSESQVHKIVASAAKTLANAKGSTFVKRDGDYCYYVEEDSEVHLWKGQRFLMSNCVTGWAMLNKESALIEDIYNDKRVPLEFYKTTFIKSLAAFPINIQDPNGALCSYWDTNHIPTQDEVQLLQTLADAATIALKNIELLNDLESRVRERTLQFETANKELEAFSYSVSHDLRAPLRAIDGFTRILVEDHSATLDDDGIRVCKVIRDNTQKMGQLIDDLLSFSRLSRAEIQKSPVDMQALVSSVYQELTTHKTREKITFTVNDIPFAFGDATMLRQVWINLISNAIKFSSGRETPQIEISCTKNENYFIYCIVDNGVGFDMKYYQKMFGVFQRLHSIQDFEGTGVGLAIVQRVINRHEGEVWAVGEIEKGATLYFSLPVVENR